MPTFSNQVTGGEHAIVGVAANGIGTHGTSETSTGAGGVSKSGVGVHGVSDKGPGVRGDGVSDVGVYGTSKSASGISGVSQAGDGVHGTGYRGVVGESESFQGVFGKSRDNAGVVGESDNLHGVFGVTHNPNGAGVFGTNDQGGFGLQGDSPTGVGVWGRSESGLAGRFDGDVLVSKKLTVEADLVVVGDMVLAGADVAERFLLTHEVEIAPGTLVVLDDEGRLAPSYKSYDARVAGIVSGAGDRKPALVLDSFVRGADSQGPASLPVAVVGKAWCWADASTTPINVGDLLTTSDREGHAMRATEHSKAFGAVVGKALTPLRSGTGPVLVLVGLG